MQIVSSFGSDVNPRQGGSQILHGFPMVARSDLARSCVTEGLLDFRLVFFVVLFFARPEVADTLFRDLDTRFDDFFFAK